MFNESHARPNRTSLVGAAVSIKSLEMHVDAVDAGDNVLLVDDLVATGGTAEAAAALIEQAGGTVTECWCVIDLPDLGRAKRLQAKATRCSRCATSRARERGRMISAPIPLPPGVSDADRPLRSANSRLNREE
jgi:hypothetical protein